MNHDIVDNTEEMLAVREAFVNVVAANHQLLASMNVLGNLVIGSTDEIFGGYTLDSLNSDWESHREVTRSKRR